MPADLLVSPSVRALADALVAVLAEAAADLPGPVALEDTRLLLRVKEQLDVHLLGRLRDVEQRQLHELDALPSAGSWVEAQTTSMDRRDAALSRRLDRLPSVLGALESGSLSMAAARQVGVAVERVRPHLDRTGGLIDGLPGEDVLDGVILRGVPQLYAESLGGIDDHDPRLRLLLAELVALQESGRAQVERVEAAFVALAVRVERRGLHDALDRLVDALLPQRLEDLADRADRDRGLVLVPNELGPGGRIEAELNAEAYELWHTALAAAMAADPDNPADTEAAAALRARGLDPYGPGRHEGAPRTAMQRRHDAFMNLLRDYLGSGVAGRRGKAVPQISIRVGLDTLHSLPGSLPAVGRSGQTLPASLVRRLACDSAITRFVMGLGNKVIEMSHTVRTAKEHERRAKEMETGGVCQAAGCHPPPGTPLVPHHPDAYASTGTTSFYDTVMLCPSSHHDVHEGRKTIRLKDGRLMSERGWIPEIGAA